MQVDQENATQTVDAEDQMGDELAQLRAARAAGSDSAVTTVEATEPAAAEPVAEAPAEVSPEPTQAPAQASADNKAGEGPSVEEQLKKSREELHRLQSDIGRVGALNHKYNEAQRELQTLRAQLAQGKTVAEGGASTSDQIDKLAAIAEQVKEFPELSGIVAAVSDALKHTEKKSEEIARRAAAEAFQPLEPLSREHQAKVVTEQKAAFDAAMKTFNDTYPTAPEVVKTDEFRNWLIQQPASVKHAFVKGETPEEALSVLDGYDMHLRRTGRPSIAQLNTQQSDAADPGPTKQATNTRRLMNAAGIPVRGSSGQQAGQPASDDFDASLAFFRKQRQKQQRVAA